MMGRKALGTKRKIIYTCSFGGKEEMTEPACYEVSDYSKSQT